jgi:hypothetical protein
MKKFIFFVLLLAGLVAGNTQAQVPDVITPFDTLGGTTLDSIGRYNLKGQTMFNVVRIHNLSYDSTQYFYVRDIVKVLNPNQTVKGADTSWCTVREDSSYTEYNRLTVPPRSTKNFLILNGVINYFELVKTQGTGAGKTVWYIRGRGIN